MSKLAVSVIIITYNEENNIEDCLKSVIDWVDEVFIVDSGSSDKTLQIAARYGAKICQHPFENFALQRNWSQDNLPIKNEWVFHLDADERASEKLAKELQQAFIEETDADAFMAARKTVFRGRWIKHGLHYPVYHIRIFKKDKGRSEERFYDQNYIVNGRVIKIKGDIINIINPDLASWKARHRQWAKLEAREILFNRQRILNIKYNGNPIEKRNWARYNIYYRMPLFLRCFVYFFYRYIIRAGFLDGKEGLVFHYLHGFWYRILVDVEICRTRRESLR